MRTVIVLASLLVAACGKSAGPPAPTPATTSAAPATPDASASTSTVTTAPTEPDAEPSKPEPDVIEPEPAAVEQDEAWRYPEGVVARDTWRQLIAASGGEAELVGFHPDGRVAYTWLAPTRADDGEVAQWVGKVTKPDAFDQTFTTMLGEDEPRRAAWKSERLAEGFVPSTTRIVALAAASLSDDGYHPTGALSGKLRRWMILTDTVGTDVKVALVSPDNKQRFELGALAAVDLSCGDKACRKASLDQVGLAPDGKTLVVLVSLVTGERMESDKRHTAGAFELPAELLAKAAEPLPPLPAVVLFDDGTPAAGEPTGPERAGICDALREVNNCDRERCDCVFSRHTEVGGDLERVVVVTVTTRKPPIGSVGVDIPIYDHVGSLLGKTPQGWFVLRAEVVAERFEGHAGMQTTNTIERVEVVPASAEVPPLIQIRLANKYGNAVDYEDGTSTLLCWGAGGEAKCFEIKTSWRHVLTEETETPGQSSWKRSVTLKDGVVTMSKATGKGDELPSPLPAAAKVPLAQLAEASETQALEVAPLPGAEPVDPDE